MTFNKNEKDDNEKPCTVCYSPLIVRLFFSFKKVGQWPTCIFKLMAIAYILKNQEKSYEILHCDWGFLNCENVKNN